MNDTQEILLPELREDLQLLEGPMRFDGSPTWSIFDPLRNRYFRIGWQAFQFLSRWTTGNAQRLIQKLDQETTCHASYEDVKQLIYFLYANNLTRDSATNNSIDYLEQLNAHKKNTLKQLIHSYLFLRIPLIRPHKFLSATMPLVAILFSNYFRNFVFILGLLGSYLVIRQWDVFKSTFLYFFNLQGAFYFLLSLVFIKLLHEFGHAYTATRYGCKVPTMGVAFLVMFPVFYTDTSDSWKLKSRMQRLHIGAAGILTELYVALICTFLWSFLPEGIMKSTVFFLASTSWLMSLGINLNVFMRFDGYYILSDWLAIENLQERSVALGKWRLRKLLFGLKESPPERYPARMQSLLVLYAWGTWLYRFILILLIALLVYHFFFKILGIILLVLEITWFIVLPIAKEIKVWWQMRETIYNSLHSGVAFIFFIGLLVFVSIPWSSRVTVPAVFRSTDMTTVHAITSGRILEVLAKKDSDVDAGDILLKLESPMLVNKIIYTQKEMEAIALRLERNTTNPEDRADIHILSRQMQELRARLDGLRQQQAQLVIRAPVRGRLVDMADNLHPDRWINQKLPLALIINPATSVVEGALEETKLSSLGPDQAATFFPDDPQLPSITLVMDEISNANIRTLDIKYLASVYGGKVAVRQDPANGELVPETSLYRIRFNTEKPPPDFGQVIRGVVHMQGIKRSFASRMYDKIAAVLIRESGF